jgi:hypothetical protein
MNFFPYSAAMQLLSYFEEIVISSFMKSGYKEITKLKFNVVNQWYGQMETFSYNKETYDAVFRSFPRMV